MTEQTVYEINVEAIAARLVDGYIDSIRAERVLPSDADLRAYIQAAHDNDEDEASRCNVSDLFAEAVLGDYTIDAEDWIETMAIDAPDIDQLAAALNRRREFGRRDDDAAQRLDAALDTLLPSLPVFSDSEPRSTDGIWSYDDSRVLRTAADGTFVAEARDDVTVEA